MNTTNCTWPADPNDKELEQLYLARWRVMHRHHYDIAKIPGGRDYADFFNTTRLTRLLKSAGLGQCDDLLYVALDAPLKITTTNRGIALQMWWSQCAWLKRRLVASVEWHADAIQITRNAIYLSNVLGRPLRA